jgi:hypothetical protein
MVERLQRFPKTRRAIAVGAAVTLLSASACKASGEAAATFRSSNRVTVTEVTNTLPVVKLDLGDYPQPPYEHHGAESNGNKKVIQSLTEEGPLEIDIGNRDKDAGVNCVDVFVPVGKTVTALASDAGTTAQKQSAEGYKFCNTNMKLRSTSAVAEAK